MVVENKTLKKIKELGLNSYEAKIWTALLSRGVSTAGEISDIANVPRSRSYDVLESLEKKGFIIMKVGKPIQYIAVPPEEVLDRVKKSVMIDAEQQVEILEEFEDSTLLTELTQLHNQGIDTVDPTGIAGYIKGINGIFDQMAMLAKTATNSIIIATDSVKTVEENLSRALKKAAGADIKISGSGTTKLNAETKNTGLKGKFMVVDSEKVLFTITAEETHPSYQTAIWVDSPVVAKLFEQIFNNAWGPKVETKVKTTITKKV